MYVSIYEREKLMSELDFTNLSIYISTYTLMHMQRDMGMVARMRRRESPASSRAQHPGPSGSAENIRE